MMNLTSSNFYSRYLVYASGATDRTVLFQLSMLLSCPPYMNMRIMQDICFLATARCSGVRPYMSLAPVFALNFCNNIFVRQVWPSLAAQCKGVILNQSTSKAKQGLAYRSRSASLSPALTIEKNSLLLQQLSDFLMSPLFFSISLKLRLSSRMRMARFLMALRKTFFFSVISLWPCRILSTFFCQETEWLALSTKPLSSNTHSPTVPFFCLGILNGTRPTISQVYGTYLREGGGLGGPGKQTFRSRGSDRKSKGSASAVMCCQFLRKSSQGLSWSSSLTFLRRVCLTMDSIFKFFDCLTERRVLQCSRRSWCTSEALLILFINHYYNSPMEYKSSSYFFPSNRHRIKSEPRSSLLQSIQRKQIRQNLSSFISKHNHKLLIFSQTNSRKWRTPQQSRGTSCRKARTESSINNKTPTGNNIGIYNILQKVNALRTQESEIENNPFYKIQKQRKNSKLLNFKRRKEMAQSQADKQDNNQSQSQSRNTEGRIFQNEGLWEVNEQKPGKIRAKSETVMYYEIKHYYEKKYGKEVEGREAEGR